MSEVIETPHQWDRPFDDKEGGHLCVNHSEARDFFEDGNFAVHAEDPKGDPIAGQAIVFLTYAEARSLAEWILRVCNEQRV